MFAHVLVPKPRAAYERWCEHSSTLDRLECVRKTFFVRILIKNSPEVRICGVFLNIRQKKYLGEGRVLTKKLRYFLALRFIGLQ